MEPTNFNKARWHYCQIFTALTSDDAIKAGVISERNVKPLLFFFMRVWDNDKIRHWLAPKEPEEVKENRLMMVINYLYLKGNVFEYECNKKDIALLLLKMNVLNAINTYPSLRNCFAKIIPKTIKGELYITFFEIFKKCTEKMQK